MTEILTVNFRGDTLFGFKEGEDTFVGMKPMVEAMGLQWSGQLQRLKRDPILAEGMCMIHTPFGRGGDQEAVCLRLELVNGWLFTIDTSRIKDDTVRERVLTYQRECYRVLHEHFAGKPVEMPLVEDQDPELRPFPNWSMEEMRTKKSTVDMYRILYGTMAAQWLVPQLGFPVPPVELVENGRQMTMVLVPQVDGDTA